LSGLKLRGFLTQRIEMKLEIKNIGKIIFGLVVYFFGANFMYFVFNIPNNSSYTFLKIFAWRVFEPFLHEGYFYFIVKTMILGCLLGMPGWIIVNVFSMLFSGKKRF
jgi:hypothetical protein